MYMIGQTISSLPLELNNINYIRIENGIYDDFYVTRITNETINPDNEFYIPDKWSKDTYLHAKFNGDLFAGNTDFDFDNVQSLIIKRREVGTYKWMPIIEVDVDSIEDFNFTKVDKFAASNTEYEYASVPIINGEEGTYSTDTCEVSFDELIIIDRYEIYSTMYDIDISSTKNNTSSTLVPIGRKYPIYVANATNDYYTGNISATFLNMNCQNMNPSIKEVMRFRRRIMNFLNNREIKYIKDPLGRCWIASIGTTISDDDNGHPYAHKISFDFTEVGDIESNKDMDRYGFLDIGKEWWI